MPRSSEVSVISREDVKSSRFFSFCSKNMSKMHQNCRNFGCFPGVFCYEVEKCDILRKTHSFPEKTMKDKQVAELLEMIKQFPMFKKQAS